jgi:hypothetical protein
METVGNKPKMKYFEGVEGIKHLYNELLESTSPLYVFLSDGEINPQLQHYLNHEFIRIRIEKQIPAFVIVSREKSKEYLQVAKDTKEVRKFTKLKTVKDTMLSFEGEIVLYGDNSILCALYSNEEMIGYVLQSKQLYKTLKSMFDFIWERI